jgi:uroporphyrin-III C-methyltransferase / precorrin-2 dehydrogenase / sirohydrochlorin ferrochelatase
MPSRDEREGETCAVSHFESSRRMTDNNQPRRPMQGLASLPIFFNLAGKRVLLAGGAPEAAWKAELLQAAGAKVDVLSAALSAEMRTLAAQAPAVTLIEREWTDDDFAGAALACGDFATDAEATGFCAAARRAGVPVNVVDKPLYCDFQFGTIVDRSPLVIAISTSGAAPVFALALRGRLEALLPASLKRWAEAAKEWRPKLTDASSRRRFWELFTTRALTSQAPDTDELDNLIAAAQREIADKPPGTITLLGISGADPEHLTLKALRLLQAADVVFHDRGVAPAIVEIARRESARISVNAEDDIATRIIAHARDGARIAWLIAGGVGGADVKAFQAAGCAVEVIPSVPDAGL